MEDYVTGIEIKESELGEKFLLSCLPIDLEFYIEPFYHQLVSIAFALQFNRGTAFFHDMGVGKTACAINTLRAKDIRSKILVITVNAALKNWENEFHLHAGEEYRIRLVKGSIEEKNDILKEDADVFIINYEGIFRRIQGLTPKEKRSKKGGDYILSGLDKEWEALILDECFVKGTKIRVLKGHKNIEEIKKGDFVYSKCGIDRVKNISSKFVSLAELVRVNLFDKEYLFCSKDHLFWIKNKGWVSAIDLNLGDVLINKEAKYENEIFFTLRVVWKDILCLFKSRLLQSKILRTIVFSKMESNITRKEGEIFKSISIFEKDLEKTENRKPRAFGIKESKNIREFEKFRKSPYEKSCNSEESKRDYEENRPYLQNKRRKWKAFTIASKFIISKFGGLGVRVCNFFREKTARLSNLLQSGYSFSKVEVRNRSKWQEALYGERKITGFEKNNEVRESRVESIEFYERGNFKRFESCFKKGEIDYNRNEIKMYDLEMENHPSFYVGNASVLVHNSRMVMHTKSIRTKVCMYIALVSNYRMLLTGMPIAKSIEEIFSQQYCLDLGEQFTFNFLSFRQKYFSKIQRRGGFCEYIPRPGSEIEVRSKMYKRGIRYAKEECLDLPEKIFVKRYVELEGDQKAFYDKLLKDKMNWIVSHNNKLEVRDLLIKFMQICGGWLKAKDEVKAFISNAKLKELYYLLSEELQKEKVVVIASFVAEQRGIVAFLKNKGIRVNEIISGMDSIEIDNTINSFDKHGGVIVMSPRVGGRAINLTPCHYPIFYSQDFDFEINRQVEDRFHRIGQKHNVTYTKLIARNTVDEKVIQVLSENKNLFDIVVEGKNIGELI